MSLNSGVGEVIHDSSYKWWRFTTNGGYMYE
jgi:hypothetical protein